MAPAAARYRHSLRVRYGEVDIQGVVFNAHYLAYLDDALENWIDALRKRGGVAAGWDMMLKKLTIEWQGSVGSGEALDIDMAISRWGRTSWEVSYLGTSAARAVFTARVLYVSVAVPGNLAIETPAEIRQYLGEAVELLPADG